jgi:hypothetical protein
MESFGENIDAAVEDMGRGLGVNLPRQRRTVQLVTLDACFDGIIGSISAGFVLYPLFLTGTNEGYFCQMLGFGMWLE